MPDPELTPPWELAKKKPVTPPVAVPSGTPTGATPPWELAKPRITISKTEAAGSAGASLTTDLKPPWELAKPAEHPGYIAKALEPFTSYPSTYMEYQKAGRERMSKGATEFGKGRYKRGLFDMITGGAEYVTSPIEAGLQTIVGKPLEENLGIPAKYSTFAAGLALPYYGLARAGKTKALEQGVEKIFSPHTVDAAAGEAAGSLRAQFGTAARDMATTRAALEPVRAEVNALPDADRLAFMDHMEGGASSIAHLSANVRAMATTMRDAFKLRKQKLQSLSASAMRDFLEDYFPHFWTDPAAARAAVGGGGSKLGSGASLSHRTVPTIAEGIQQGLTPLTTDPIEAALRYVGSMDRFIAQHEVLEIAQANGHARWVKPRVIGASGHPASFEAPPGWVKLEGRGTVNANGAQLYAPEGFARVYNNFVGRGIYDWGGDALGNAYDVLQRGSNAITALELGLSGFHAVTMANEAGISKLARGIGDIVGGAMSADLRRVMRGVGAAVSAPAAFITSARRGHEVENVYLGRSAGSPNMQRIVSLLERAGGRGSGMGHARDYQYSAMGSYWRAWRQGALGPQLAADVAQMRAAPITGSIRVGMRHMGRIMQTVAEPLFEHYIPKLKNGAFYEHMQSWLEANPHASYDEQVAMARRIWDSIDNRFGEMVNDNVFWNTTMKQVAQLGMRSYSWNMGTAREIGGGVADIARGQWSPKAAYVVALPIWVGTMNAAYQYLKTGKGPQSVQDLVAGQTGGTSQGAAVPPPGGKRGPWTHSTVPERVEIPGYQKDVFGWYNDWQQEIGNKIATGPKALWEIATNRDWRGDPIINPDQGVPDWLSQYMDYATKTFGPISIRQAIQGQKRHSNISPEEGFMGLRPAGPGIADPKGAAKQQERLREQAWKKKTKFEEKQEQKYKSVGEGE